MAASTQRELESLGSSALFRSPSQTERRTWGHQAFKFFLDRDGEGILDKLEYPLNTRRYVLEAIGLVHSKASPKVTEGGLEFRSPDDSTGQGKHTIIDSPKPEMVQLTATAASSRHLDQDVKRGELAQEARAQLSNLFGANSEYLLRMCILYTGAVNRDINGHSRLAEAVHSADQLPPLGLRPASGRLSGFLSKIGLAAIYETQFKEGSETDISIDLTRPVSEKRRETWRALHATKSGLVFIGRVVEAAA